MSQKNVGCRQGLELSMIADKAIINALKKCNPSPEEIQKIIEKPGKIYQFYEDIFGNKEEDKILSLISVSETLILEDLDGKATIANAKNTFKSYLDSNFKNWRLNNKGNATKETPIQVYEMVKDATFSQMFNSLSSDLDSLCLTQNQIIRFCEKYPSHLRQDGYATFFLFKESGEYFVASVNVSSDGLFVLVNRFEFAYVWSAEFRHRLVVPQLDN